ncbi:MAG: amino acid carrier protein [Schleiferiaceae bacterium]|nr:amino acid carrier protein [Schleiferiaceae bacterium]
MDLVRLNDFLATIDGYIGGSSWFVFALLGSGVFFTIYLKFPQIRYFSHAIAVVRGKFDRKGAKGDTSHFQSLTTALSGTVGTGNIAGVAFAIHLGGPAALFWMLVTAALGMTTKFVEVTLSHKYREFAADGTVSGGPMYYMKNKLGMKWMAGLFAVAAIISSFGTGNMPQVNSIASSLKATFGIEEIVTGAVLSVLLGLIILGGIKRIAAVTEKLVPMMAVIYVVGALSVIIMNYENIIPSFISIFADVFSGSAASGGFLGATIAYAFNRGVNRGLFSNEAGQGSAPIAHAAAKAEHPVSEGMVAILEPFIDTIVICSITGLTLLSSGVWNEKHVNDFSFSDMLLVEGELNEETDASVLFDYFNSNGDINEFSGDLVVTDGIPRGITVLHARSIAEEVTISNGETLFTGILTVDKGRLQNPSGYSFRGKSLVHSAPLTAIAFNKGLFGDYGQYIVAIGLLLFAFSTAISWSYYGGRSVTYLFGVEYVKYYRILYVIGFFLAAIIDTTIIWTFAGIAIALMTIPNLLGIFLLRKDMKKSIEEYKEHLDKNFQTKI